MSYDLYLFLPVDALPGIAELKQALQDRDVPASIIDDDALTEWGGYVPMTLGEEDAGFEWDYGPIDVMFDDDPPVETEGYAHVATMMLGGDERELVCALDVAGVIAKRTGGVLFDPQEEQWYDAEQCLQLAASIDAAEG